MMAQSPRQDLGTRNRRRRSLAIALALGAFALLFYLLTIVKMGPAVLDRPL